jgi:hypothetical protein
MVIYLFSRSRSMLASASVALGLLAAGSAFASPEEIAARYPKGGFTSTEQADRALQEVRQERAAVEAHFADEQYACYSKFFSSPCVDHAKTRRRDALKQIRSVEIDAEAFQRRAKVDERDRALREQAVRDAAEAPERTAREKANAEKAAQRDAERAARAQAQPPGAGRGPATPKSQGAAPTPGRDRVAEHEAKVREEESASAAGAAQREQNIADYQRKQEEAKERQRRVAEKVEDRERRLKEKAAQREAGKSSSASQPEGAK